MIFYSKKLFLFLLLGICSVMSLFAGKKRVAEDDRAYWCRCLYRIAAPVLSNMSEGRLSANMQVELSPDWDGRDRRVTYMEAFGRTMVGIAPWLSLPDDETEEGKMRRQLREWALKSYKHAVDPDSPDYLLWRKEGQSLVDAAFIAESFIRAYDALWEPLDKVTKQRYIEEFRLLRRVKPNSNNWVLFAATIECFLKKAGEEYDMDRIMTALRKIEDWYVGDGWYSDGADFAFDYYNSFVIQPMNLECVEIMTQAGQESMPGLEKERYTKALKRMQRYAVLLERFISPEGTFPVFGRSMTYRLAVFQPLALLARREQLPRELPAGQVRAALTAVMKRMFEKGHNFNEKGFLVLGFNGHQPEIADYYTNNGSLYMTTVAFLPLGLPAGHPFWREDGRDWTQKKAWGGQGFLKDHAFKE